MLKNSSGYSYVTDTVSLTSLNLTKLVPIATTLSEMTQNNGHHVVQGHSR